MKKLFIFLFAVTFLAWGYYLWGNRKRFFQSGKGEVITDYTERVRLEKELDSLQEKYDYLLKLCSDTTQKYEPVAEETRQEPESDSRVDELIAENAELRRELDQIKSERKSQPKASQTTKQKKSDEKNIPIARNSRAVELQKFLTDLYGDR